MFRCIPYVEAMQEEWDRIAFAHGTVYHSVSFRHILIRTFGYRCLYQAVVDEAGRVQALMPLVAGRNLSMKKAGVSLPFINYLDICAASDEAREYAFAELPRLRETYGLDYIELRLKEQRIEEMGWTADERNCTFVLPLAEDEETVLGRSSSSNRNHVRKVYKKDEFDVSFESANLPAFYEVYVRRMKQLGSPAPDIRYFEAFFEWLPNYSHLLTVFDKAARRVIGGMLLVTSPTDRTVYYPYGANLTEYNGKYLNNYMYWEAVRFGIRGGYDYLDLGRSPIGSGTYKYKEQWGAIPVPLRYMTYTGLARAHSAPDKESLQLFIDLWKRTPSFITNSVGKRLIKYLLP